MLKYVASFWPEKKQQQNKKAMSFNTSEKCISPTRAAKPGKCDNLSQSDMSGAVCMLVSVSKCEENVPAPEMSGFNLSFQHRNPPSEASEMC